jgi:rod shape-determining protein MreD
VKNILIIIGSIFIVVLDALLLFRLEIKFIRPDYLFIIIFLIAFHRPIDKSILPVWIIGLAKDIISQSGLGTTAFLYLISAIVISLARQIIFKEDIGMQMIVLFFSVFLFNFLNGMGVFLYYFYGEPPIGYIIVKSVYISLYTVIIAGIVLIAFHQIHRYVRLRARRY